MVCHLHPGLVLVVGWLEFGSYNRYNHVTSSPVVQEFVVSVDGCPFFLLARGLVVIRTRV